MVPEAGEKRCHLPIESLKGGEKRREIAVKSRKVSVILILTLMIIPIGVALAYNVTGEVTYFYAYHRESDGLVGVNVRCKVDLNHTGDPPNYVKFRYLFEIPAGLKHSDDTIKSDVEPLSAYYIEEWKVYGWQGDGEYDSWWNWIPANPSDADSAQKVYVDIYVDSDSYPNNNGVDWVCDDVTEINDNPP